VGQKLAKIRGDKIGHPMSNLSALSARDYNTQCRLAPLKKPFHFHAGQNI
jgi:hypothetical protein